MSLLSTILISISLFGLLLLSIFRFLKTKKLSRFIFHIFILIVLTTILYVSFYSNDVTARGSSNEIYFVIVLYICMILGIVSANLYKIIGIPKTERKKQEFDLLLFLAPILVAPIVFLPTFIAFQNAEIDFNNFQTAKLSIFLVAFQNGFFWKEIFDNKRKSMAGASNEK